MFFANGQLLFGSRLSHSIPHTYPPTLRFLPRINCTIDSLR